MVAKITSKLDESQAERQLEALRQSGRHTVLWMSFCQTESLGRFVFDNSIKASFSLWRVFFFFGVCWFFKTLSQTPASLKLIQVNGRAGFTVQEEVEERGRGKRRDFFFFWNLEKVQWAGKAEAKWSLSKCKGA